MDVRLFPGERHAALVRQYRYLAVQTPNPAPDHALVVGLAFRLAD